MPLTPPGNPNVNGILEERMLPVPIEIIRRPPPDRPLRDTGIPVQSSGGGYSYRPNPSSHSWAICPPRRLFHHEGLA